MKILKKALMLIIGLSMVVGLGQLSAMQTSEPQDITITPEALVLTIRDKFEENCSNGVHFVRGVQRYLLRNETTLLSIKNSNEQTVLHIAARDGFLEVAKLILLAAGPDRIWLILARDSNGHTASMLAEARGHQSTAEAIQEMTDAHIESVQAQGREHLYFDGSSESSESTAGIDYVAEFGCEDIINVLKHHTAKPPVQEDHSTIQDNTCGAALENSENSMNQWGCAIQ